MPNYSDLFDSFWHRYGSGDPDFDGADKGPKTKAYEAWLKAIKRTQMDETAFSDMVGHNYSIDANNRRIARKSNKWKARLPMLATWLNQDRWSMDVAQPASSYAEQEKPAKACGCGKEAFGRSEDGGWICKACHLQLWYDDLRKTTDPVLVKWTPRMMQDRYPRLSGETWVDWSRRVSSEIIRTARPGTALGGMR